MMPYTDRPISGNFFKGFASPLLLINKETDTQKTPIRKKAAPSFSGAAEQNDL